jgi:tRNA threonylcarbamoyladenosine biosynthesis protein TsaE
VDVKEQQSLLRVISGRAFSFRELMLPTSEDYNRSSTRKRKERDEIYLPQSTFTYNSRHEEDTDKLGRLLAAYLQPGTVFTLDGDLGAGKTRFSQGFARAMGITEIVNSPTFTIIKEYEGAELPFYHMDMYRISQEEADELGLDDYFYGAGVTLIEWSSLIEDLLPPERLAITIAHQDDQTRVFHLTPHGAPYQSWCVQMKENGHLQ